MILIILLFSIAQNAFAQVEHYYVPPQNCPKGTTTRRQVIAKVDDSLLPQYILNQGETLSCGIHARMVLLNSVFRWNWKAQHPHASQVPDLSFVDGMLRYGKSASTDGASRCSLSYSDFPVSFLVKAARGKKVRIDNVGVPIGMAHKVNKTLLELSSSSINGRCVATVVKPIFGLAGVRDIQQILDRITTADQEDIEIKQSPLEKLNTLIFPLETQLPAFQIEPWDRFDSETDLLNQIVRHFGAQDPLFPIALDTCIYSSGSFCVDAGHAVALSQVTQVECLNNNRVQAKFYEATLLDSLAGGSNGPFDLAALTKGMYKNNKGFAKIIPCSSSSEKVEVKCGLSPIIDHAKSDTLFHYIEAADLESLGGENINKKGLDGLTALHVAAKNNHASLIPALIAAGAKVNAEVDGWTPLNLAAYYGNVDVVKVLIASGAIVNTVTKDGNTPLISASQNGHLAVVEELLRTPRLQTRNLYRWKLASEWADLGGFHEIARKIHEYESNASRKINGRIRLPPLGVR